MKRLFLLLVIVSSSLCSYSRDTQEILHTSIGWWGGTKPAIVYSRGYNDKKQSFEEVFVNNKLGTETSFLKSGDDIILNNTKYGAFKANLKGLLTTRGFSNISNSRVRYDLYVLPDDNIFLVVDIETTNVVGSVKLPDKIVNVYGYDMVVEGGTAPIRETTGGRYVLILDTKNEFKAKSILSIPEDYDKIVFSSNNRFYMFREQSSQITCFDYDGNYLWRKKFDSKNESIHGVQETTNYLYLVGAYENEYDTYGFYTILDCRNGKEYKSLYDTKYKDNYFEGDDSFILKFNNEGIVGYYSKFHSSFPIRYRYVEEDAYLADAFKKAQLTYQISEAKRLTGMDFATEAEALNAINLAKEAQNGKKSAKIGLINLYLNKGYKDKAFDLCINDAINSSSYGHRDETHSILLKHKDEVLNNPSYVKQLAAKAKNNLISPDEWDELCIEAAAINGDNKIIYKQLEIAKEHNPEAVIKWLEAATKYYGSLSTMYELAVIYLDSTSGHMNISRGVELLTKVADNGNIEACHQLGNMYKKGLYVTKDKQKAKYYLKMK